MRHIQLRLADVTAFMDRSPELQQNVRVPALRTAALCFPQKALDQILSVVDQIVAVAELPWELGISKISKKRISFYLYAFWILSQLKKELYNFGSMPDFFRTKFAKWTIFGPDKKSQNRADRIRPFGDCPGSSRRPFRVHFLSVYMYFGKLGQIISTNPVINITLQAARTKQEHNLALAMQLPPQKLVTKHKHVVF